MKPIFALIYNLIISLLIGLIAFSVLGADPFIAAAVVFAFGLIPRYVPKGALRDEVLTTIFSSDLQEKLFPDNSFYKGAQVDTGVAEDADKVEVPQDEDGEADYVENPKKYPLEVVTEEDTKKSYTTVLHATKPQLVTDLNQAIVSYDKRAAKLRKHVKTLNTKIADRIMYEWGPTKSDYIRQTTGNTTRAAKAPGATGNRKRVAKEDVFFFFSLFNDLDVPTEGRRLVIPAYMYEDLLLIDEFINSEKLKMRGDLGAGQIGEILGFRVYMRSKTTVYTEASTPVKKAPGAATAETDNQSALFFHPDFVRYAEGMAKVYINPDQGQYLGTTMNAKVRGGGMISRLSEIGVGVLVEDNE